jgi:hypothetical protein
MTDRELLELAAKASWGAMADQMIASGWDPLTDDGDALRLAVKLNMHVNVDGEEEYGKVTEVYVDPRTELSEPHSTNPYAATRRAIVMAAAKVGEELT